MRLLTFMVLVLTAACEGSLTSRQDETDGRDASPAADGDDPRDARTDVPQGGDAPLPGDLDVGVGEPDADGSAVDADGSAEDAGGSATDAPSGIEDETDGPLIDAESPDATDDEPAPIPDVSDEADVPAPPSCPIYAGPTRPASCPLDAEVVIWTQNGWNALADAIAAEPSDCAEYWIAIRSLAADSTMLRPGEAARMHARGETIHAMAEFHWHDWNAYRQSSGLSWTEIGHLFRQRMVEAGYCVESGDTWGINEAPTSVRLDEPGVRDGLEELTRALYEGVPGMATTRGAVFVVNFGHGSSTSSVYKSNLRSWLTDATFWGQMNLHVRFWAQEVYTDPDVTCVPGSTRANRGTHINEFTMHPIRLAAAAPSTAGAGTAETYLNRSYTPLLNGFWGSTSGYGHTDVPLDTMLMLISEQVRATRLWADDHLAPDGRTGFAFGSNEDPPEWTALGQRIARAIRGAYGRNAAAAGACFEGPSNVWCDCSVPDAAFTSIWTDFGTW